MELPGPTERKNIKKKSHSSYSLGKSHIIHWLNAWKENSHILLKSMLILKKNRSNTSLADLNKKSTQIKQLFCLSLFCWFLTKSLSNDCISWRKPATNDFNNWKFTKSYLITNPNNWKQNGNLSIFTFAFSEALIQLPTFKDVISWQLSNSFLSPSSRCWIAWKNVMIRFASRSFMPNGKYKVVFKKSNLPDE